MKTNYVPAIVMLLAGAVYCLFGLRGGVPLKDFTVQLLVVLLVFYVLGAIIRLVLDKFMGEIEDKTQSEDTEDAGESDTEEEQEAESKEE